MEQITVEQIIGLMSSPDTIMITEGSRVIAAGYLASIVNHTPEYEEIKGRPVKRLTIKPDISHKEWKKRGLLSPVEPERLPEYSFSDLQMTIYRKIEI